MTKGEHIKVRRLGYDHHGISAGDGDVIHYTGKPGHKAGASVKLTSMREFLDGGKLEVVRYANSLPADEVVERAMSCIGESEYNIFFNNCEHFARWCKTGDKKSEQVSDMGSVIAGTAGTGAVTAASIGAVSMTGSAAGLSGAGVMSGLAAIGPGGVIGGLGTLAVAPSVVANLTVGKILEDDEALPEEERDSRTAGRIAAKVGTLGGAAGVIGTVSSSGTVTGLSAAGLTSGLAAIGSNVGGGMVAGTAAAIAAPAVAAVAAGLGVYKLWQWIAD